MWLWITMFLSQGFGWEFWGPPQEKQHTSASQRQPSQGIEGLNPDTTGPSQTNTLKSWSCIGWPQPSYRRSKNLANLERNMYTSGSLSCPIKAKCTNTFQNWAYTSRAFWGNTSFFSTFQTLIFVGFFGQISRVQMWRRLEDSIFQQEVFLVGDIISSPMLKGWKFFFKMKTERLLQWNLCITQCPPKKLCVLGDPCQCQPVITSKLKSMNSHDADFRFPPSDSKIFTSPRWGSKGHVLHRAYCELCDKLTRPGKPHRRS